MASVRHIENRFLAISRHHIGWLMWNLEQWWRITRRYRSRDQNAIFENCRHFENSFISISQPWIIRFRSNLVCGCKFPFRRWRFDKYRYFANSRWWTDAILKMFFAISWRNIGRFMRNLERRWRITRRYRSRDQNGNFRKFKMTDGLHFENCFISISQPWIIRFRSNLVRWCKFPFRGWSFDTKSKFCEFKMADRRHIENRFLSVLAD